MAKKRKLWVGRDENGPFISREEPIWEDGDACFTLTRTFEDISEAALRLLLGTDYYSAIFAKQIVVSDGAWEIEYLPTPKPCDEGGE